MYKLSTKKSDGRGLWLYSRQPIPPDITLNGIARPGPAPAGHLRWHPLRAEWVAYAGHRQARTFLPPADSNPLAPSSDPAHPTELPEGQYDIAVFENLFPTLGGGLADPPASIVPTRPAQGAAEVVVFTQDPSATLAALPLSHLELLIEVWGDRYRELGARPEVLYVMPFENRGVEVGVTLQHPHGQIYAYPFVPPIPATELAQQRQHLATHGRGLIEMLIEAEEGDGRRIIQASAQVVAFTPAFARYAYEVWIAPRAPRPSLAALSAAERRDLAVTLKTVLLKYDRLWQRPFPYVMVVHQAPVDGQPHPEAHVHFEFYPAYRMKDRLKYLAGSELGAGMFTADTLPEDTAATLAALDVSREVA